MDVLVISDYYQPLKADQYFGGSEAFSIDTWKLMNKYGHKSYLLGPQDSLIKSNLFISWDSVSENAHKKMFSSRYVPSKGFNLDEIKNIDIGLVIVSTSSITILKQIVQFFDCPIFYFHHRPIAYRNDIDFLQHVMSLKTNYSNLFVVAVSAYLQRVINRKLSGCIDSFIHLSYFEHEYNQVFENYYDKLVVYTGRITIEKMIPDLLDIFRNSDYKLLMIGNPQFYPEKEIVWFNADFEKELKNNKNFHYKESMDRKRLFEYVRRSSLFFMPRHTYETFSLSAFEAQKLGIPVVCIVKHPPEAIQEYLVENKTGFVINTFGSSVVKKKNEILDVVDKAISLDRKWIFEWFHTNYSAENYVKSIFDLMIAFKAS